MDLATKLLHLLVIFIPFSFVIGTFILMNRVQKSKKTNKRSDEISK